MVEKGGALYTFGFATDGAVVVDAYSINGGTWTRVPYQVAYDLGGQPMEGRAHEWLAAAAGVLEPSIYVAWLTTDWTGHLVMSIAVRLRGSSDHGVLW